MNDKILEMEKPTLLDLKLVKRDEKGRTLYSFEPNHANPGEINKEKRRYKHSLAEKDIELRTKSLSKYVSINLNVAADRNTLNNQFRVMYQTLLGLGVITEEDMMDVEHLLLDNTLTNFEKTQNELRSKVLQAKLTAGIMGPNGRLIKPKIVKG